MWVAGQKEVREYQPVAGTSRQASGPSNSNQSHCAQENRSEGNTSAERQSPVRRHNQRNLMDGDPDDDDDGDGDSDCNPQQNHNFQNRNPSYPNRPSNPNGGGGGGNPGGGGGGDGPNEGGYQSNMPQGNIPYGNLVATI